MDEPRGFWQWLSESALFRRDPITGGGALLVRLYRLQFLPALFMSLPLLVVVSWYGLSVVIEHHQYEQASGLHRPMDAELFQLLLHDRLERDLWRHELEDIKGDKDLPVYHLRLGNGELARLDAALPPDDGSSEYVPGYLKKGNDVVDAGFRYRGSRHWHWAYPQKSWKIRLGGNKFIDEQRILNLINPVDPLPFSEQLVMDLARSQGVLTPDYSPIRVILNNAYMGLYYLQGQPDESILRRNHRMPGNIYSGNGANIDKKSGLSKLFWSPKKWKRPASREGVAKEDREDLKQLLHEIVKGDRRSFTRFARQHLNLETFATFDALDVVFGGNQHDWDENHKLYFDPYKGRFEPIAWNYRGWEHRNRFNRVENPLLLRLKEVPEYLPLRNRKVWELLHGPCSPEAIETRSKIEMTRVWGALLEDPYWDAYHLSPDSENYFSQMVRPMDFEKQARVFDTRMQEYRERYEYLTQELAQTVWSGRAGHQDGRLVLVLDIGGHAGVKVSSVEVLDATGNPVPLAWWYDTNDTGAVEEADPPLTPKADGRGTELLVPGFKLVARGRVNPKRGAVTSQPDPRSYRLLSALVPAGAQPASLRINGTQLVTGDSVSLSVPVAAVTDFQAGAPCVEDEDPFRVGRQSWNSWCLRKAAVATEQLGPGRVVIDQTRVFDEGSVVRVMPGTEIELKEGASLIFRGQAFFAGTDEAPIRINCSGSRSGLALLGQGTAGSRLENVRVEGGGFVQDTLVIFTAVLNIQDTHDILVRNVHLAGGTQEGLHSAYVTQLTIEGLEAQGFGDDCLDMEFSSGIAHGLRLTGAGDDCMDLMGTQLEGSDWDLVGCKGNALSAGEETHVKVERALLGNARRGLTAKNASRVRLREVLLANCTWGIRVEKKHPRYDKASRVKGKDVVVFGSLVPFKRGGKKLRGATSLWLNDGQLPDLRARLGLKTWMELGRALREIEGKP